MPVIRGVLKELFAPKITLGGLNRDVTKYELYPQFMAASRTMDQITFGVNPQPLTFPSCLWRGRGLHHLAHSHDMLPFLHS